MADLSFLPTTVNVTGKSGDRVRWNLEVKDEIGNPLDWSGYGFVAQLRTNPWDSSAAETITVDDSASASGLLVCTLLPAQTSALLTPAMAKSSLSWYWDLQRTETADSTHVRTTHAGTFTLQMDVTR